MSEEKHKILIVDSDPASLMFLDVNLTKFGYEVITADNTERGLTLANSQLPALIICDLTTQKMDGIEFCWRIRETSAVKSVPFIILTTTTDQETHINGFRSGADAFITKPISIRMIITRLETLIWRYNQILNENIEKALPTQAVQGISQPEHDLSGKLSAFSLIEFLQFANMSKKTGIMTIRNNQGVIGKIAIHDGEVLYAETDDATGEEAAYRMAGWEDGDFGFQNGVRTELKNIQKPTMKLILDCCSVIDMANIIVRQAT